MRRSRHGHVWQLQTDGRRIKIEVEFEPWKIEETRQAILEPISKHTTLVPSAATVEQWTRQRLVEQTLAILARFAKGDLSDIEQHRVRGGQLKSEEDLKEEAKQFHQDLLQATIQVVREGDPISLDRVRKKLKFKTENALRSKINRQFKMGWLAWLKENGPFDNIGTQSSVE